MAHQPSRLAAEQPGDVVGPVDGLSTFAVVWRLLITACIALALGYGTIAGNDGDWPFGPMRQYATATPISSQVVVTNVSGVTLGGDVIHLDTDALGLRVAELDAQLTRLRRHPELLLSLASAYRRAYPSRPPLVRLILERDGKIIRDRKVVGSVHRIVTSVHVPTS